MFRSRGATGLACFQAWVARLETLVKAARCFARGRVCVAHPERAHPRGIDSPRPPFPRAPPRRARVESRALCEDGPLVRLARSSAKWVKFCRVALRFRKNSKRGLHLSGSLAARGSGSVDRYAAAACLRRRACGGRLRAGVDGSAARMAYFHGKAGLVQVGAGLASSVSFPLPARRAQFRAGAGLARNRVVFP